MENAAAQLATYAGITGVTLVIISGLKGLFKGWVKGKEPLLAVIITYILGIAAKIGGLYPTPEGHSEVVGWLIHAVLLLGAAVGAGVAHDKLINPLIGKTGATEEKKKP